MTNEVDTNTAVQKNIFSTKDMTLIAMFAVLMAVCSWISIPTQVPFTLQTFAVFCTLGVLGGKRGFFAVLVYVLLGAVGVPVFAGFTGGIGVLLGTTGGYILGFILSAGFYWLTEKLLGDSLVVRIISMVIGLALCYFFGTVWFVRVFSASNGEMTLYKALQMCVIPFVVWDIIKLALALALTATVRKRIKI